MPAGFQYEKDFIDPTEESILIEHIESLPLQAARYKQFTAKRQIVSYGGSYDFASNKLLPAMAIPQFLHELRERLAGWAGIPSCEFGHALIAKYEIGTQLGWHRDVPDFELVAGVTLHGSGRMRFRPYPPKKRTKSTNMAIDLEPRSAYILREEARWGWQHSISPCKSLRYSITFRTRRTSSRKPEPPQA